MSSVQMSTLFSIEWYFVVMLECLERKEQCTKISLNASVKVVSNDSYTVFNLLFYIIYE